MSATREDGLPPPPEPGSTVRLPDPPEEGEPAPVEDEAGHRSLLDDLEALIEDGKTYLDAELSYQKSRAGFVAANLKRVVAFGAVAAFLAVLALIGLTVGLIFALTPLVTAWGATAIVVGLWLLIAYLLVRGAGKAWRNIMEAVSSDNGGSDNEGSL